MGYTHKWKALAAGLVGMLAAGGTGVAMAQGGLSANLALSGTIFKVTIDNVLGQDFQVFVDQEKFTNDKTIPVTRLRFGQAKADNLCVSANLGELPGIGPVGFELLAAGKNSADIDELVIGATLLDGNLSLENPSLGTDMSTTGIRAPQGTWGLNASAIEVQAREVLATSVSAQTITLRNTTVKPVKGHTDGCS